MSARIVSGYINLEGEAVCVDCTGILPEEVVIDRDYLTLYEDSDWKLPTFCGICTNELKLVVDRPEARGMTMYVYRNAMFGDMSNGGVTSKVKQVTVTGTWPDGTEIARLFSPWADAPEFVFEKTGSRWHVIPVNGLHPNSWWTFGGNFIHCSDSRTPEFPVHVHDRQERNINIHEGS